MIHISPQIGLYMKGIQISTLRYATKNLVRRFRGNVNITCLYGVSFCGLTLSLNMCIFRRFPAVTKDLSSKY